MVQLKYSDIPAWLKDSEFYCSLNSDEPDSQFEIPVECFQNSCDLVNTAQDVANILKVVQFWGVRIVPLSVLEFSYASEMNDFVELVCDLLMLVDNPVLLAFKKTLQFTLEVALATNRPELVTFWLSKNTADSKLGKNAIVQACRFGKLDLIMTLREKGFTWSSTAYCAAAQYKHLNVLYYLHKAGLPVSHEAQIYAARGGHIECMKFLHSIGCKWKTWVTIEYALSNHYATFPVVAGSLWTDDFSIAPPVNGYIECLRYALENGCPIHYDACARVVEYALLDCLQLLRQHGASISCRCGSIAAKQGSMDMLQFMHDNGRPWYTGTIAEVARNGHLDCLKQLHLRGCPWDAQACKYAAWGCQLDCLIYLHENNCPWDEKATVPAAEKGSLECLKYLHQHGCPWDKHAIDLAAGNGHLECIRYLHANGCTMDVRTTRYAVAGNHLHCLQYLHENNCPWSAGTSLLAAKYGHIACLQYCIENRCPFNIDDILLAAARAGSAACLQYLKDLQHIDLNFNPFLFDAAFLNAQFATVKYLIDCGYPYKDYQFAPRFGEEVTIIDEEFLRCLKYAVEQGWCCNRLLHAFVSNPRNFYKTDIRFPLCRAYLETIGKTR